MGISTTLLNNILFLIGQKGISEARLLKECGIHRMFLTNWKNGTLAHPKFEDIYLISQYFGVSMDSLAGYTPSKQEEGLNDEWITEKNKINAMIHSYSKLDANGRAAVCRVLNEEELRMKNEKKFDRRKD